MTVIAETILHQAAVIAYRIKNGKLQILLVTSRESGRWIIPKGNIPRGLTPAQAATQEAYEEAGVKGEIAGSVPWGVYTYLKRLKSGENRPASVEVFVLRVTEQHKKWPEKCDRTEVWLPARKAMRMIQEPGIVPLIKRLREIRGTLMQPGAEPQAGKAA